jgi:hypothetical protein
MKVNACAARAEDGLGYLPIEIAFRSVSPVADGCSQEVLMSNKQVTKMVKALLAFHPETAHITNEQFHLPLHVVALTELSQAIDIMQELIDRFPQGLMMQKKQGKFPMDLTRNRAVLKALTTPPTSMDHFYKKEPLHVCVSVVLASLLLITSNGILLSNYWNHHLRATYNFGALRRGALKQSDTSTQCPRLSNRRNRCGQAARRSAGNFRNEHQRTCFSLLGQHQKCGKDR